MDVDRSLMLQGATMSDINPGRNSTARYGARTNLFGGCVAAIVLVAAVVCGMSVRANRSAVLPDATTEQSNQQSGASLAGAPTMSS